MHTVRLSKALTLLLPFRCHPLRLKHRLLESLGQVSRFMLDALHDGLPCEALPEVTGLSEATVNQQMRFLSQHGFLTGLDQEASDETSTRAQLTERGQRTVLVDRMLHGQSLSLWVDAFTLDRKTVHVLADPAPDQLVPDPSGMDFHPYAAAIMPMRQRYYRPFDEMGRLRELLNADTLPQLLAVFLPEHEALIRAELDHWEISLREPASDEPSFLPLPLPEGEAIFQVGEAQDWPSLPPAWLPVLTLHTRYSRAEGLPWPVILPAARQRVFEMVSLSTLAPALALQVQDGAPPKDAMALPSGRHGVPAPETGESLPLGVSAQVTVRSGWLSARLQPGALVPSLQRLGSQGLFSTDLRPETEPSEAAA